MERSAHFLLLLLYLFICPPRWLCLSESPSTFPTLKPQSRNAVNTRHPSSGTAEAMAMDQPLKRKRGRPTGAGSQSAKSKMEQKMALVKQRLALLDSSSSENYKDDDFVPMVLKSRGVESVQRKLPDQKTSASVHEKCGSAMDRAKEVQAKLSAEHPSFAKYMLQSHVVRGFWLGLPTYFCNKHLPKQDTGIVLEDENGDYHDTTYLGAKQGLSAGWRGFAIKHGIKVDDVVVFQLVEPTKFKVYIIRANEFTTTDGALGLLNLDVCCKKGNLSKEESSNDVKSKDDAKVSTVDCDSVVSEAIEGITISDSDIDFDDVTSFSNFSIIVDSLVIDCKFHDQPRRTYYELCRSQKSFLHKHLLKQLNLTLVVGVIMETISIAEGIRACKAQASSQEDLLIWKKTLESFELLGMNVAFLLKRVNDLLNLPTQSRDLSECQKYKELKLERARAGVKVKALELQLSNVKNALQKVDADMEQMESSVKNSALTLQQLASAPW
ncbi:B3 domain-containing protein Os01g0234100-like isoform X2 [Phragmites australis]|uniref:B3 domain-containing protein Os01g0234100-like isoform X2 n=1 Tax=Phragmites australis TaxID=29695 RepID=UPI002D766753|nr:B3 domain-containing protein Os01g0234100-like isoform X2 [Phragmites australis]